MGFPGNDYLGPVFDYLGNNGTILRSGDGRTATIHQGSGGCGRSPVFADLNNNGVFDAVYSPGGEGPTRTVFATQVPRPSTTPLQPTRFLMSQVPMDGRRDHLGRSQVDPQAHLPPGYPGYLEAPNGTRIELFNNLPFSSVSAESLACGTSSSATIPSLPTLTQFLNQNRNSGRTVPHWRGSSNG